MTTASLTDARGMFSEIVEDVASTGNEWVITRHGQPLAVVISYDEYESLIESLNILSDDETMSAINEGLADLAEEADGEDTEGTRG
ncbi:MAG TPA: type II toxin-antitoxin system Phd/YefM family antitoxin [Mycobacteriales bacterium]|nr:type II toxin-antitoxin system Phd/YefM family antitoxin [Mycobacteriales bacterium]